MDSSYYALSPLHVALASLFVVFAGILSFVFRLGLIKKLAIGALRVAVQLGLAGIALTTVFGFKQLWLVILLAVFMVGLAAREAINRQRIRIRGASVDIFFSILLSAFIVTTTVTGVIVNAQPWWTPNVFIPILGMVLGNSLNGITLALDHFLNACVNERERIESRLMMGATPNEAVQPQLREAIRRGMIPILNAMAIVGIVSLPGMMTGQLLAGADPKDVVAYQIVVMYMLTAATGIASICAVLRARKRVFTKDMALRTDLSTH